MSRFTTLNLCISQRKAIVFSGPLGQKGSPWLCLILRYWRQFVLHMGILLGSLCELRCLQYPLRRTQTLWLQGKHSIKMWHNFYHWSQITQWPPDSVSILSAFSMWRLCKRKTSLNKALRFGFMISPTNIISHPYA